MKSLDQTWYEQHGIRYLLWPFALLFRLLTAARRLLYVLGIFKRYSLPIPVIVVGNITVGGTGKTPLVIWLANHLKRQGFRPGIISRGYGGNAGQWPQYVRGDSDPTVVGDEPVLIARHTECPVAVSPKRIQSAKALMKYSDCDVIISDDGLQHYALMRDIEIAVIDGVRRFGNGYCLPAGPLREPVSRLKTTDFVVCNGLPARGESQMKLSFLSVNNLREQDHVEDIANFRGRRVHAIAGIGNPKRFFSMLKHYGLQIIEHPFPDHHPFQVNDISFNDNLPVIMTEKDAVKCRRFSAENCWFVSIEAEMDEAFIKALDCKVGKLVNKT